MVDGEGLKTIAVSLFDPMRRLIILLPRQEVVLARGGRAMQLHLGHHAVGVHRLDSCPKFDWLRYEHLFSMSFKVMELICHGHHQHRLNLCCVKYGAVLHVSALTSCN